MWTTSNLADNTEIFEVNDFLSEAWQIQPDGGCISLKLATTQEEIFVLQFIYTKEDETIWWDMSSISLDQTSDFVKVSSFSPNDTSYSIVACDAVEDDCFARSPSTSTPTISTNFCIMYSRPSADNADLLRSL